MENRKRLNYLNRTIAHIFVMFVFMASCFVFLRSIKSEAATVNPLNYITSCKQVSSEDFLRNCESYTGSDILIRNVYISQIFVDDNKEWYHGMTEEGHSIVLIDDRTNQNGRILEGDTVDIYGKGQGLTTVSMLIGGNKKVPQIKVKYFAVDGNISINTTNIGIKNDDLIKIYGSYPFHIINITKWDNSTLYDIRFSSDNVKDIKANYVYNSDIGLYANTEFTFNNTYATLKFNAYVYCENSGSGWKPATVEYYNFEGVAFNGYEGVWYPEEANREATYTISSMTNNGAYVAYSSLDKEAYILDCKYIDYLMNSGVIYLGKYINDINIQLDINNGKIYSHGYYNKEGLNNIGNNSDDGDEYMGENFESGNYYSTPNGIYYSEDYSDAEPIEIDIWQSDSDPVGCIITYDIFLDNNGYHRLCKLSDDKYYIEGNPDLTLVFTKHDDYGDNMPVFSDFETTEIIGYSDVYYTVSIHKGDTYLGSYKQISIVYE
ncbi:hypothetical protein SAMN04487770_1582 [Butyrivibrio sp. ob235]|uniref:hypothetical protein n=1 Tax=Butyrivibrio sp. ob235 TaxID=1761780 RepID=UPI0008C82F15|nr:hypothetical protein [Butyrivibrio sp. ob235]SEM64985.1 hypothetical protein SAMN04487770_1582 [Butyrivibrio sp. ob235]